jgi:hypothetical protein
LTAKISKLIYSCRYTSLTTDSWTCIRGYSYTAINVHTIVPEFQLMTICAGLVRFEKTNYKKASASALASQIREILSKFPKNSLGRTCLDMASLLIADGAAVMGATAAALGKNYSHCLGHRIQLFIKQFVLLDDDICAFIGIGSKIVNHVRRSTTASDTIGSRLQTYSRTRFNSYFLMVSSILKNWKKINEYANNIREKFLNSVCEFENYFSKAVVVCFLLDKVATLCTKLTSDSITLHLTLMEFNYFEFEIPKIQTSHIYQSEFYAAELESSDLQLQLNQYRKLFMDCWRDRYIFKYFCYSFFIYLFIFLFIFF